MTGPGRVVVLVTSPRVAPGLLSFAAWDAVSSADTVLAADPDPAWVEAVRGVGFRLGSPER
mgnify:CR=1 FL=1